MFTLVQQTGQQYQSENEQPYGSVLTWYLPITPPRRSTCHHLRSLSFDWAGQQINSLSFLIKKINKMFIFLTLPTFFISYLPSAKVLQKGKLAWPKRRPPNFLQEAWIPEIRLGVLWMDLFDFKKDFDIFVRLLYY